MHTCTHQHPGGGGSTRAGNNQAALVLQVINILYVTVDFCVLTANVLGQPYFTTLQDVLRILVFYLWLSNETGDKLVHWPWTVWHIIIHHSVLYVHKYVCSCVYVCGKVLSWMCNLI